MAAEHVPAKNDASTGGAAAGGEHKGGPVRKATSPLFSKRGRFIFAAVASVQAVALIAVLLLRGNGKAEASAGDEHDPHEASAKSHERAVEAFLKVGRSILELGELKVPITSAQPRAPRSITANVQVVVSHHLEEKLSGGGGHGGGSKNNPQKNVLILNMRSILRSMMEAEGVRLLEANAKIDFERRAKDRLNNVQIDGDEEKTVVMRILKGQVLQVIIDKFDTHSF